MFGVATRKITTKRLFLTIHLEQVLKHWDTEREALIQGARVLTEQFRRKN